MRAPVSPRRGLVPLLAIAVSLAVSGCTGEPSVATPSGLSSPSTTPQNPNSTASTPALVLPTVSAAPLPAGRTQEIETALASGNEEAVQGVIVLPTGASLGPAVLAALKGLDGLHLDPTTFHPISSTTALIDGSTDGQQWTVYLTLDGGVWKIAASEAK